MCSCMKVSKNSYYNWLRVGQTKKQKESILLLKSRVTAIFNNSKQVYVSLRIQNHWREKVSFTPDLILL
jgi:uncharacterized protein involved in tolerance to divalent cations